VLDHTGRSQEGAERREASPGAGSRSGKREKAPTRIELVCEALQASA
jgi:hypothetical protein